MGAGCNPRSTPPLWQRPVMDQLRSRTYSSPPNRQSKTPRLTPLPLALQRYHRQTSASTTTNPPSSRRPSPALRRGECTTEGASVCHRKPHRTPTRDDLCLPDTLSLSARCMCRSLRPLPQPFPDGSCGCPRSRPRGRHRDIEDPSANPPPPETPRPENLSSRLE